MFERIAATPAADRRLSGCVSPSAARASHRRRAGLPRPAALRRTAPGRARRGAGRGGGAGRQRVRRPPSAAPSMMAGELAPVARAALADGERARRASTPALPAGAADARPDRADVDEALADLDERVALEWKLDGARIQVHKAGDEIGCSRATCARSRPPCPKSSRRCAACRRDEVILDGEVIALRPDGAPADLPADDAAIRPEAGRRAAAGGAAADAVLLRLPLRRRRGADRRARRRSAFGDARRRWRPPRSCRACCRPDSPKRRRASSTRRWRAATRA